MIVDIGVFIQGLSTSYFVTSETNLDECFLQFNFISKQLQNQGKKISKKIGMSISYVNLFCANVNIHFNAFQYYAAERK